MFGVKAGVSAEQGCLETQEGLTFFAVFSAAPSSWAVPVFFRNWDVTWLHEHVQVPELGHLLKPVWCLQ